MLPSMWRPASLPDDEAIVRMCLALDAEDPGPERVHGEQVRRTLETLRKEPWRGQALVLELEGRPGGYALLVSFWSNELGGETAAIDEIWVDPSLRGQGHASRLVEALASGALPVASGAVALTLEITPGNSRARRLYERLGFRAGNQAMVLRLRRR